MEVAPFPRTAPSRLRPRRSRGVASCSDAELYDHLFHYCRIRTMLGWGGASATGARKVLADALAPLWAEAERRGLPLHHLPGTCRGAGVEDVLAA